MEEAIDIKLVILGEGNTGKTSLVNKFLGNEIPDKYLPTIGNNVTHKDYILDNKRIRINIWDCGGQKAFNDFNPAVYNNVDGAFLVFDLSRPEETIKNLKKEHIEHLEYYSEEEEEGILFFVGNKEDLVIVNKNLDPVKNALNEDDLIVATSALSGENVNECFELLIYTILKQTKRNEAAKEFIKSIGKTEEQLIDQVVDLANIDILLLKEKVKAKTTKIDTISTEPEESEVIQFHDIQKELNKIDFDRNSIFDKFNSTLSEMEETVDYLKKASKNSIDNSIEDFGEQLIVIGNEIESDLKYLSYLEKEENSVIDRLSEIPEIRVVPEKPTIHAEKKGIEIKPIKKITEKEKIKKKTPQKVIAEKRAVKKEVQVSKPSGKVVVEKNLYHKFENIYGKKAIINGEETVEFLDWMNSFLGIKEPIKEKKEVKIKAKPEREIIEINKIEQIEQRIKKELVKDEKIKEKMKIAIPEPLPEEDMNQIYEKENPRKKAIFRGKETQGFRVWKDKYLETKKEKLGSEIALSHVIEVKSDEDFDLISQKIKSDLTLEDEEEYLYQIYEKENVGKHAKWRGKLTKGFLEWKENYLKK